MIYQNFYLLIFKPLNIKLFVKYCRLYAAQIIPSGEHYSQHGGIHISCYCYRVCGSGFWVFFFIIWCVVVAQMLRVRTLEPQHPGFRNQACLMRAFTLPVGVLHISTVL